MDHPPDGPVTLHASAIAFGPAALLIIGASGTGKSTLALQLLGMGAVLVSDDRVVASRKDGGLWLSAPKPLRNMIEARNMGLLACATSPAWARAVVDLDKIESNRLPSPSETVIAGVALPSFSKVDSPAFPSMLRLCLEGGLYHDA